MFAKHCIGQRGVFLVIQIIDIGSFLDEKQTADSCKQRILIKVAERAAPLLEIPLNEVSCHLSIAVPVGMIIILGTIRILRGLPDSLKNIINQCLCGY